MMHVISSLHLVYCHETHVMYEFSSFSYLWLVFGSELTVMVLLRSVIPEAKPHN